MSTPAIIPAHAEEAHKKPNGFIRFIDAIGHLFVKAEPTLVADAVAAEPLLALTPAGPEYTVAVNAIAAAQKVGEASIAAGTDLTNEQKFSLAVQAATPALNTILTSKGVTADQETHVNNWIQAVFNILAGPVATLVKKA